MTRGNLSAWAVAHPTLILFLILMVAGAGGFAYAKLGRAEDPSFTIKTVVISAAWPGATAQEMQFQVADRIEKRIQEMGETEIESRIVGEELMKELHQLDQVAYVRFASVYREFKDIDQFMDELRTLAQQRRER